MKREREWEIGSKREKVRNRFIICVSLCPCLKLCLSTPLPENVPVFAPTWNCRVKGKGIEGDGESSRGDSKKWHKNITQKGLQEKVAYYILRIHNVYDIDTAYLKSVCNGIAFFYWGPRYLDYFWDLR
jgi:hypothetical protein